MTLKTEFNPQDVIDEASLILNNLHFGFDVRGYGDDFQGFYVKVSVTPFLNDDNDSFRLSIACLLDNVAVDWTQLKLNIYDEQQNFYQQNISLNSLGYVEIETLPLGFYSLKPVDELAVERGFKQLLSYFDNAKLVDDAVQMLLCLEPQGKQKQRAIGALRDCQYNQISVVVEALAELDDETPSGLKDLTGLDSDSECKVYDFPQFYSYAASSVKKYDDSDIEELVIRDSFDGVELEIKLFCPTSYGGVLLIFRCLSVPVEKQGKFLSINFSFTKKSENKEVDSARNLAIDALELECSAGQEAVWDNYFDYKQSWQLEVSYQWKL